MKITDVSSMRLWGPLFHGVGGQQGMIGKIVVRVDSDQGLYGLGEADDFMGVREGLEYINEYVKGRDPLEICPLVSELVYGSLPPHHPKAKTGLMEREITAVPSMSPTATSFGPILWAVSGFEMALCDLVGKALKTPVYSLLGGKFRDRICIYLDRSSPAHIQDPEAWRVMAREAVAAGFTQVKFDIEYIAHDCTKDVWNRALSLQQINRIVERLAVVREEIGPDFELCVDCHMHFNAADAIRLANELEYLKLLWLEDPTPIVNPDSCADVRARSRIPICLGEMFTAEQYRIFIDRKACDIIHPDVMFSGGLHETRKISDYADLHHLSMAMHGNGGCLATIAAAHVAAASRNFRSLEYHFIETPWVGDFVTRDRPLFEDGHICLTDEPGLGVRLNKEVCQRHLVPGESLLV